MVGHYLTHLNHPRQDIRMLKGLNFEDKYGNKDDWSKEFGDKETKAKVLMRIMGLNSPDWRRFSGSKAPPLLDSPQAKTQLTQMSPDYDSGEK